MDAADRAVPRGRGRRRAAYNARRLAGIDAAAVQQSWNEQTGGPVEGSPDGRWVPIGPSVVLGGQAVDLPRVTGRIRDIAVDADGVRAYAAAGMGGVWYTADGGGTWTPIDGWAPAGRFPGGVANGLACGCLLVTFGPSADQDVVLLGTGEPFPDESEYAHGAGSVGVLSAIGPAAGPSFRWESETGLAAFAGTGMFRLVRDPSTTAGADGDRILACTGKGAFLGVRGRGGYYWTPRPELGPVVYDAAWLSDGRILVLSGLNQWEPTRLRVSGLDGPDPDEISLPGNSPVGLATLAHADGDRFYVRGLGGMDGRTPQLWRLRDVVSAPEDVDEVCYDPDPWHGANSFQSLAVDAAADDIIYIGGAGVDDGAELFRSVVPENRFRAEWIGPTVHADVHAIRLTGTPEQRQVWVATDGGVFVSRTGGAAYTYVAVNTGIAALEPEFARTHPLSGHLVAAGMQDNGTDIRTGDTTWAIHAMGDGGGLAFVPHAPHVLVYQYTNAYWGTRTHEYVDPFTRMWGWPDFRDQEFDTADSEYQATNFYSGADAVRVTIENWPAWSRLAIGTNRVWVTDDLPMVEQRANTWRVLPYKGGLSFDPRSVWTSADLAFDERFGTPGLGPLFTLAWASPAQLIAVFDDGVVRWTEREPTGGHHWRTETWTRPDGPWHHRAELTDVCPVPGTQDFYITTTGAGPTEDDATGQRETVWFVSEDAAGNYRPVWAEFPRELDGPRDPVFSITLDPADPSVVFIGTVTGVWRGKRDDDGGHRWTPYPNGLPQAIVQDLHAWTDPDRGTRLLRAALASRGLWEVDLGAPARRETWIRATPFDDRRSPWASIVDPRVPDDTGDEWWPMASPDIVVRPAWPAPAPPPFPGELVSDVGEATTLGPSISFDLWTFQTACRWRHPSVAATGRWSQTLERLLGVTRIDEQTWNDVMTTRAGPDEPFAVYRPPWQTAQAPDFVATEADLAELVVPVEDDRLRWTARALPSTVEILLHHRDSRAVPAGDASVTLLWRIAYGDPWPVPASSPAGIVEFLTGVGPVPTGWRFQRRALTVPIEARLPRAVSIDLDLSGLYTDDLVILLAYVESVADDQPRRRPSVPSPETLSELIRCWPSLAARVVTITGRDRPEECPPADAAKTGPGALRPISPGTSPRGR